MALAIRSHAAALLRRYSPEPIRSFLTRCRREVASEGGGKCCRERGILVQPTGPGSARVAVTNAELQRNGSVAIRFETTDGSGGSIYATVENADFDGSSDGFVAIARAGSPALRAMLVDSQLTSSSVNGIRADGAGVMVGVAVTNNGTGLAAPNGSVLRTYGNNGVKVNTTDGNFTVPISLR